MLMIEIYHSRLMADTSAGHSYHRGVIVYKVCLVRIVWHVVFVIMSLYVYVCVYTFVRIHLYVFIWRINF